MRDKLEALCSKGRWLSSAMKGLGGKVLLSGAAGGMEVACGLGFVMSSKWMIDIATGVQDGSFRTVALVMSGLVVARLLFASVGDWLGGMLPFEVKVSLRDRLYGHLFRCRWLDLNRYHTGDLLNRANRDVDDVARFASVVLPDVAIVLLQFLVSFAYLCSLDSFLSWWLLALMAACFAGGRLYAGRMHRHVRAVREGDSRVQSAMQEDLQHHALLKALGQVGYRMDFLRRLQNGLGYHVRKRVRLSASSRLMVSAGFGGGYLLVFVWGAYRLSAGDISFGVMAAFLQLVGYIQRPVFDFVSLFPSFVTAYTAIERLQELEVLPEEECGPVVSFSEAPAIRFNKVCFSYPDGTEVFNGFDACFPARRFTAVVGESGVGKTTLVRLLLALASPDSGSISLCGIHGAVLVSPLTRGNFVYVPQGDTLFSGTVRENLWLGHPQATDAEMEEVLRVAEAGFVLDWKDGLDTMLEEAGGGLSEGQMQRIAIARALLCRGRVLLLDEATSALDVHTERRLMANLREYCSGQTVVFVTHHAGVAEACDGVVRL